MRDRETIDQELRRIALGRQSAREQGGQPSIREVDALLDERLGHRPEVFPTQPIAARETSVLVDTSPRRDITAPGRKRAPRRFGLLAALPLSLLAIAAGLVVMFGMHKSDPAPPAVVPPPSDVRPSPAAPAAPVAHAPPLEIVDRAFIGALKQEGVPVPSNEYVTTHGHAVCEFLTNQPDFAEAVRVLQQSTIWDANQSASVAAGAVIAYCPQYQPSKSVEMQPGFQDALSGLQNIERDLKGIQGDLQGIHDGLPALPGGE
jgi:uncharacterized protein DUF732